MQNNPSIGVGANSRFSKSNTDLKSLAESSSWDEQVSPCIQTNCRGFILIPPGEGLDWGFELETPGIGFELKTPGRGFELETAGWGFELETPGWGTFSWFTIQTRRESASSYKSRPRYCNQK